MRQRQRSYRVAGVGIDRKAYTAAHVLIENIMEFTFVLEKPYKFADNINATF